MSTAQQHAIARNMFGRRVQLKNSLVTRRLAFEASKDSKQ
jgi:hypothetical protein